MNTQEVQEVTAQEVPANWLPKQVPLGMLYAFTRLGYKPYLGTVSVQEKAKRRAANRAARKARRFNRG